MVPGSKVDSILDNGRLVPLVAGNGDFRVKVDHSDIRIAKAFN